LNVFTAALNIKWGKENCCWPENLFYCTWISATVYWC